MSTTLQILPDFDQLNNSLEQGLWGGIVLSLAEGLEVFNRSEHGELEVPNEAFELIAFLRKTGVPVDLAAGLKDMPAQGKAASSPKGTDLIGELRWVDPQGHVVVTLKGLAISIDDFEKGIGLGTPHYKDPDYTYDFLVSLLNGDTRINASKHDDPYLEVGEGGKATVEGKGGDDHLFVWHQKDVDFDGGKGSDTLEFGHEFGSFPGPAVGAAVDLTKGKGTNPFGGTLKLKDVENVVGVFNKNNDLRGDKEDNFLLGGTAADKLRGEGGDDTIYVKYWTSLAARPMSADGGKGHDTLDAELRPLRTITESQLVVVRP